MLSGASTKISEFVVLVIAVVEYNSLLKFTTTRASSESTFKASETGSPGCKTTPEITSCVFAKAVFFLDCKDSELWPAKC